LYRQACCWEVGSSEAKSSKDRERERAMEVGKKEDKRGRGGMAARHDATALEALLERKRGYGCKA
jgi:hypothetical protein